MLALLMLLQATTNDIVITGKRLQQAQAVCARGSCTPLRDAQASIALAEELFRRGDYVKAKELLAAAAARNRVHAVTDPKAVAAIWEAYATVLRHEGDQDQYRIAVRNQVETLRDNLPADDPAVAEAAPALGDMWTFLGNQRQAAISYRAAEARALKDGQGRTAILLGVRHAYIVAAQGDRSRALHEIDALAARPIASTDPIARLAVQVVRFRIAAHDADDREVARLAAAIGSVQTERPALLYSPPLEPDAGAAANADARKFTEPDADTVRSSDLGGIQWVDIGFWIRPDGRTAEAEVLRGSRYAGWAPTLVCQIEGRRYSVTADAADAPGVYRIERITRRSAYMTPIDSFIRRRVTTGGYEVLELTDLNQKRQGSKSARLKPSDLTADLRISR